MKKTTIELLKKADYSCKEICSFFRVILDEAKEAGQSSISVNELEEYLEHFDSLSKDAVNFAALAVASEAEEDTEKSLSTLESASKTSYKLARGILAKYEL